MEDNNQVIVNFCGRMANQMFQWAFGKAYEVKQNVIPVFDDSEETLKLNCFKLNKYIKLIKNLYGTLFYVK